jgi:hypothetical protein
MNLQEFMVVISRDHRLVDGPCRTRAATEPSHGAWARNGTCALRGGVTIRERWLSWNEGRSFASEGVGIPLVARARNEWTVQADGDQTLASRAGQRLPRAPGFKRSRMRVLAVP